MFKKNNKKIFIVAEIGNNHEGNLKIAKRLITEAKKCGVDAVKFQTFKPELFVSKYDKKKFNQLKKFQFSFKQFEILKKFSKKIGISFFSTPLDIESAKFLNRIQSVFKIASSDNNFYPLIELIASFNKPIIISTGLVDIKNIKKIVQIVFKIWKNYKKNINRKLILMHCVSNYPVEPFEANLKAIETLKKKFNNCVIGYSDHTIGNTAAISAVALGARVIEKHFTLNKNYSNFRDHKLSANPKEMQNLVKDIRNLEKMLGNGKKVPQISEKKIIKFLRRKPVANRKIFKGEKIELKDIKWIRINNGISNLLFKKNKIFTAKSDIDEGELINKRKIN